MNSLTKSANQPLSGISETTAVVKTQPIFVHIQKIIITSGNVVSIFDGHVKSAAFAIC